MDNSRFRLIKRLSPGPYVFILTTLLGTEKALDIRRRETGVRIPDHPVPLALLETLQRPLYSKTKKKTMLEDEEPEVAAAGEGTELPPIPEEDLFEGGWELDGIDGVDLVLDDGEERERIFSTILDISSEDIKLIRQGTGPWPV
jgi:tRNA A37 threonylcarbamoyladenosine synthetase subunit TsaC/SUA5/YrdC